jgi:predicted RNase H-like nuclease (RuvC/YqgF family)
VVEKKFNAISETWIEKGGVIKASSVILESSFTSLKQHKILIISSYPIPMPDKKIEDLKIRIDLLQDKIWANEDKIKRHIEYIASQVSKLKKLDLKIKQNKQKLEALEKKISKIKGG